MPATLGDRVWAHGYRLKCVLSQAGTRDAGTRVPVYAHRDEMVRDLAWIAYEHDTLGSLLPHLVPSLTIPPLPDMSKVKVDALRHPTQMAERMLRGMLRGVRLPAGDCEDWAGLILACGLAGFARKGWLAIARYEGRAKCHAVAQWEDTDGTWTASNWFGGRPVFGRPSSLFKSLDSLVRWPVHLAQDQSLVLGWPEVVT